MSRIARSWSFVEPEMVGVGTTYGTLGPIPNGDVLRRLRVFHWSNGASVSAFGAHMCSGGEASVGQYGQGTNLIQRGVAPTGGDPRVRLRTDQAGFSWFEVPIGIAVQGGPQYVIVELVQAIAAHAVSWLVTLEVQPRSFFGQIAAALKP